ncbi:MAG: serine/threonine-protein kinase [Gemmatimonadetes bacterium]|nr:serine/threonine-protein kinase [Gemmatimonadota bacterium]
MSSTEESPDAGRAEGHSASHRPGDPERIGPYHLLEVLGEGGMGIVYLAEQREPVHRRVALKIIKLGMDTHEVVRRFESERQALAVMDHPNIALVLDGGATETGRPYFVMELVRGVPITSYADTHKLSTEERLRLFRDVCAAVQHAHQKGVIHRDLKPSNVLVTVQESKPLVKVIDFGVAKAVGQGFTDQTLVTRIGQMIGTPEYMSPEQAEMTELDVDTRTDVYSLGVMLYELMVGALPFDLATRPEHAIPHALRERDTPRPSTRLTSLGKQQTVVAQRRRTTADALRRRLKGDLDWIILMAMDKDRTRRYDTANGLSLDVARHLANEPVLARPPSTRYRLWKFAQRHQAGMAASAIAIAAIVMGGAAATMGFVRARRAQAAAEKAQAAAVREAETAQQTSNLLTGLFTVNNPSEARGNTITAREILDRGADRINTQLTNQPVVQGRMMRVIGEVYTNLGLYDRARPLLQKAVALHRTADSDGELALSLGQLGELDGLRGDYEDGEHELEEARALGTRLYGANDIRVAGFTAKLGAIYLRSHHPDDAVPYLREALGVYRGTQGADSAEIATELSNLGGAFFQKQQLDSAEVYYRQSLDIQSLDIRRKLLPPDDPLTGSNWNNLGAVYYLENKYAEAKDAYERAKPIIEKVYGPDHPKTAALLTNLGEIYWHEKRYADAERLLLRDLQIKRRTLAPDAPDMATPLYDLANVYRDEGRYQAADSLYRRAIRIREKVGPDNPALIESLTDYAEMLERMGRPAEAKAMRARAEKIRSANAAAR